MDILGKQAENQGKITGTSLKEILEKYGSLSGEENIIENTLTTKEGKHEIKVSDIYNGTLTTEMKVIQAKDIAKETNKSKYYGATVSGYTCTNNAGVNAWKIFYADENNIYMIADDYIASTYVPKGKGGSSLNQGNTDYKFGFGSVPLDYNGSSDITDSKIKALNNDYFTKGYTSAEVNMKAVSYMLDTSVWSVFAGNKAEYAIGGSTIEIFLKSYNQKHKVDYRAQAMDNGGYQVSKDGGENWANVYSNLLDTSDGLYLISSEERAKGMWLGSPLKASAGAGYLMVVYGKGHLSYDWNNISEYRFSSSGLFRI